MRWAIIGCAVLCFAAALAITGAGGRVPVPPDREVPAQVAEAPVAPSPAPVAAPPAERLESTVEDLVREQAASRELVSELQTTVARLQQELSRRGAGPSVDGSQGRTLAVLGGDLFPPGEKKLSPEARSAVLQLVPEILARGGDIVSVEGHTDSRPIRAPVSKPFKDNADLSLMRAREVAAILVSQGIAAARVRVRGWGDTRPLASNDTAEGRDRNRRVEIRLLAPAPEP